MTIITTRPESVLDAHASLTALLWTPPPAMAVYLQGFMQSVARKAGPELVRSMFYPVVPPHARITEHEGQRLAQVIGGNLAEAVTYQVTAEMTGIMHQVADKDSTDVARIEQAEIPCEAGFAWLDDGWPIRDISGVTYIIRAVSWRFVTAYTDGTTTARYGTPVNWPCARICLWVHSRDDPEGVASHSVLGDLQLIHTGVLPFGMDLSRSTEEGADSFLNLLHLLWMFLGMEITSTRAPRIKNHYRKHALRSLKHGEVHVVILRKVRYLTERGDTEAQHVDWSCRWLVQGHYRHLTNPAAQPGAPVHRAVPVDMDRHCAVCGGQLTWVHPYLKGPDGLPLKVSRTLLKLAR